MSEAGFEFADFAAAETGHVDVVAGAVGFVVVAVAAEMEEIEFVDEAFFFEEVDGAVDGDEVHGGVHFLGALEDLSGVDPLGRVQLHRDHELLPELPGERRLLLPWDGGGGLLGPGRG